MSTDWSRQKPKAPGVYETRWPDRRDVTIAEVVRRGRGLQCRPEGYPPCAMGDVVDDELEWRKIDDQARS